MAKILLRSGDLDDFQAVGENGQAVFDSALQIRETLRLRKQALGECLAIPQLNDDGDRVDWYAPMAGKAIGWAAASDDERWRALRLLESAVSSAQALSQRCQHADKTAQQLFGALLSKALQFPGPNHLFLVDGKPVITFWGFVNLNQSAREDVLDCLREAEPREPEIILPAEPEPESEPEPARIILSEPDAPLLTPAPPPQAVAEAPPAVTQPAPQPELKPEPEAAVAAPVASTIAPRKRTPLWLLPLAAAIAVALAGPQLWQHFHHDDSKAVTPSLDQIKAVEIAPAPIKREGEAALQPPVAPAAPAATAAVPTPPVPAVPAAPVSQADTPPAVAEEKPTVAAPAPEPAAPVSVAKNVLVMDAGQVKAGSTRFLNGVWRVQIDSPDPVTGKPPSMRYEIRNNKGSIRVTQGDDIVCRAELYSGLHQSGTLMIKSRGSARCSDGSRYRLPEIACKAGTNGVAECSAQYDEQTILPLTFKKVSA